jgi:hypothetical protein
MTRQRKPQNTLRDGRLSLAIAAYQNNKKLKPAALARTYDVSKTTLLRRLRGTPSRLETVSVNQKLHPVEEQSLVQWILDLDRRGFPP